MTALQPIIQSPAIVSYLAMAFSPPMLELVVLPQALHSPVEGLARAIQLAVTPVFLLAAISGLLGVLTSRLARIVDQVMEIKRRAPDEERLQRWRLQLQLQLQRRRMDHASRAIGMATVSFLLVAMVVVLLFLATLISFDPTPVASSLFVLAMLALMGAVSLLLLEVRLGRRVLEFY
ncbi:MAG: DUF2721 domain-containing protein [Synechococcaceae cyanobacterium ELA182]